MKPSNRRTNEFKLLLLGSGESGKSTLFKRMLIMHGRGFSFPDRSEYVESIVENTIESMKTLVHQSRNMEHRPECRMRESSQRPADILMELDEQFELTKRVAKIITTLWSDPGIKATYEFRAEFQVPDSAPYFFVRANDISADGYVPSEFDILRCRDRTTGINSEKIHIETRRIKADFNVFDVGGQRSERRHWVNVFDSVKAVLFVVAISEYDQVCFEDDTTNRLEEALKVFKMVAKSKHFEKTPIVILFNKTDLFQEKLQKNVNFHFRDYDGPPGEYNAITAHVREVFERLNDIPGRIITEFVCAIEDDMDLSTTFEKIVKYHAILNRDD